MFYQQEKLKNGLNILFVQAAASKISSAQIWFRAGSALETYDNEGIAHFLEHMFFKGTEKNPGAKIAHDVESFGGDINAFTSFDYTCYYMNGPKERLKHHVSLLMEMVSHPLFAESDIIPERDVVFEEYRRSLDNPNQYGFSELQKNAFTSGYAHPILGREDTIKAFSREQLVAFRTANYNQKNALLIIAGDLTAQEKYDIIAKLEQNPLPEGPASHFPKFELQKADSFATHEKDVKLCQIYFSLQAPEMEIDDAAAEDLALNCFGHGETSPLYHELVVKQQLAQGASASTMFMAKGGVHFLKITAEVQQAKAAIEGLEKLIQEYAQKGFDRLEVQKIQNQYFASKVYEKESLEAFAFSLGHSFAQNGDIESEAKFLNKIKSVPYENIISAFQKTFKRPMHVSVQLPSGTNAAQKKTIKDAVSKIQTSLKKIAPPKETPKDAKKISKLKYRVCQYDKETALIDIGRGIKLIYRYNPQTPTFVLHSYLKGGLTLENTQNNGSFYLLTTLMSKGHRNASYERLKMDLEIKSSSLSGFSGKNAYGLTLHSLSDDRHLMIDHFFNSLLAPKLEMSHFSLERKHAEKMIQTQEKDPVRQCFGLVNENFYGKHPYSLSTLGTLSSLKKISPQYLAKIHQQQLVKSDILFTLIGDISLDDFMRQSSTYFDELKKLRMNKAVSKKIAAKKIISSKQALITKDFDREQTQIFIGLRLGDIYAEEQLAFKILTAHLSGQSSELFIDVRDKKGLCYTAQPVHFAALEAGHWGIYMASGHDKVPRAIAAIKDILSKHQKDGLTKEDFIRSKQMIQGQLVMGLQTNEDWANFYSVTTLHGKSLDYPHESVEKIKAMKYERFQELIKKALKKELKTFIVGRQAKKISLPTKK
jgi:zinc protease